MISLILALLAPHSQAPLADIKFQLVGNHIYVPATVNGKQMEAIFDFGAGMSTLDLGVADRMKLASNGMVQAGGVGKQIIQGKLLAKAKVKVGGLEEPLVVAIPLGGLAKSEGRQVELILGYEFFADNVIEIDYPNRRLRIYAPGWKPGASGTTVPMRVVDNHPHIVTDMVAGGKNFKMETLLDTGASGGGLTRKFLNKTTLNLPSTSSMVIGGGVGGFVEGRFTRPSSLTVASYTVSQPVFTETESQEGATGAKAPYDLLLGGDILKRFKVTFDYANSRITFEPGSMLSQPFEADKTGLRLITDEKDLHIFKVFSVMPGSSSSAAGLQIGDYVETIDGKPAATWSLPELREMFKSSVATGWDLGIRRGSQKMTVHVAAKSII